MKNVFKDLVRLVIPSVAPKCNGFLLLKNLIKSLLIASVVSGCNGVLYPNQDRYVNPMFAPNVPSSTGFNENAITPGDGATVNTNGSDFVAINVTGAFPIGAIKKTIHYRIGQFSSTWEEVLIGNIYCFSYMGKIDGKYYYYFTYSPELKIHETTITKTITTKIRTMIIKIDNNLLPTVPTVTTVDNSKIYHWIDSNRNVVQFSWGDAFIGGDLCLCNPNIDSTLNFSAFASTNEALVKTDDPYNPDSSAEIFRGQGTTCKWPFDGRTLYCKIFAWNSYGKVASKIFEITR